ncbi:MAG TPA: hypothetical protein VK905_04645, partial [Bacillota bacterium]|nr:hypothetical protein [Bacillota bacterium]
MTRVNFPAYAVIEHDGVDYVAGLGKRLSDAPDPDTTELFFDLLGLVQEPLPPFYRDYEDEMPMQTAIPSERIATLTDKYGLPHHPSSVSDDILAKKIKELGGDLSAVVHLPDFRYRVAWLYHHYQTWYELERNIRGPYTQRSLIRILNLGHTEFASEGEELRLVLATEVSAALGNVRMVASYDAATGKFNLRQLTASLINLGYVELARLMAGETAKSADYLRRCANPLCGRLFIAAHGHQKYCINCDRRSVHRLRKT